MSDSFQERRLARATVDQHLEFRFARQLRVRDRVQSLIGATPFEDAIDVRREGPAGDGRGRAAGVATATRNAAHHSTLHEFLRRAGA